jgi:cytochrome c
MTSSAAMGCGSIQPKESRHKRVSCRTRRPSAHSEPPRQNYSRVSFDSHSELASRLDLGRGAGRTHHEGSHFGKLLLMSQANRYHHDPSKAPYLADRIRKGSVGDWGKVAMPAHDDVDQKLAIQLASYILSLTGSLKKEVSRKYRYTNTAGKPVIVDFPVFETDKNRQVVSDTIFGGFEKYNSYCFRCHGFDAAGGEYAPDLRQSLNSGMTKHGFFTASMEGRQDKGMPAWAGFFSSEELNQIYEYVKARSLDLIGPGRPPSRTD